MAAKGLGSLAGRQNHIRGLVEALQQVAAEERIKAVQLKLFENLNPGDAKKVQ